MQAPLWRRRAENWSSEMSCTPSSAAFRTLPAAAFFPHTSIVTLPVTDGFTDAPNTLLGKREEEGEGRSTLSVTIRGGHGGGLPYSSVSGLLARHTAEAAGEGQGELGLWRVGS